MLLYIYWLGVVTGQGHLDNNNRLFYYDFLRHQVLEAMGQKPTEEELFQMISEVDENMSGSIDFAEFLKVCILRVACTPFILLYKPFHV